MELSKFKYKVMSTGLLMGMMALLISCGKKENGVELVELIKPEHDRITYYQEGLVKITNQEEETWYYLSDNSFLALTIPDGTSPWKREADYIWITDENGKRGIVGLDGQMILPCRYDRIEYHPEANVFEQYERTDDGMKISLMDTDGDLIYSLLNGAGNDLKVVSEKAFLLEKDFAYSLIDRQGRKLLPDTYTSGSTYAGSGYVVLGDMSYVGQPGYKYIYKDDGTLAIDRSFEFVSLTEQEDYPFLARLQEDDDFYLMSADGQLVLEEYALHTIFKEETLFPLTEKLFYYQKDNKQCILNKEGELLLQTSYGPNADGRYLMGRMSIEEDSFGLLFGDGRWNVIDDSGREILRNVTEHAENMLYQGGTIIMEYETDSYRLYNLKTQELIYESDSWNEPTVKGNYFVINGPDGCQLYNDRGNLAADWPGTLQSVYFVGNKALLIVEQDGKQGLYELRATNY